MYFKDEDLQKWKVESLREYLLQRGFPIGNNTRKANLTEKVIFAQKLDLPNQRSQEEREKEILNAKHNKLSNDSVQVRQPNKKTGLKEVNTYQLLFRKILINMHN